MCDQGAEMDDGNKEDWEDQDREIRTRAGVANISEKIRLAGQRWL